jgi:hypothetical protein
MKSVREISMDLYLPIKGKQGMKINVRLVNLKSIFRETCDSESFGRQKKIGQELYHD